MKKRTVRLVIVFPLLLHSAVGAQQIPPPTDLPAKVEALLRQGRYLEALPLARQVAEEDAGIPPAVRADRLRRVASALSRCERDAEARPFLEQALQILERTSPREVDPLASARVELGSLLVDIGDFQAAEHHIRSALDLLELRGVTVDEAHAEALAALGHLYLVQAKYQEAQPLLERALTIRRQIGEETNVAWSLYGRAALLSEQNRYREAQSLVDESLELFERTLGPEDPAVLNPLVLRTWNLLDQGDAATAAASIARQLRIAAMACGPDSSLMTPALMQRALVQLSSRQLDAALGDAERSVRLRELATGADSPRLAAWVRMRGDILARAGDFGAAEKELRRSIELLKDSGSESLIAVSLSSLGGLLLHQGRTVEAKTLLEQAQALLEASPGLDRLSLTNLQHLIHLTLTGSDFAETGSSLLERAISLAEKIHGPGHIIVGQMKLQLAPLLQNRGEIWLARSQAERALQIFETTRGAGSAEFAAALLVLGSVDMAAGDFTSARVRIDRAHVLLQSIFGDEHPATASSVLSLAHLLQEQGDLAGASALFESAAGILQTHLGPDHPAVIEALAGSAASAMQSDRFAEAERLYDQIIEFIERSNGTDSIRLAPHLAARADLYRARGQLAKAEELLVRARKSLGERPEYSRLRASIEAAHGVVLTGAGRFAEARQLFEGALHSLEALRGTEDSSLVAILQQFAALMLAQASYTEAEAAYERALLIIQKIWGTEHHLAGHSLIGRGAVQEARGDFAAAQNSFENALKLWQKVLGPGHAFVAAAWEHLGRLAEHRGDLKKAEDAFLQTLQILRATGEGSHPLIGQALLGLGNVRLEKGDYTSARSLLEEALNVTEGTFGPAHPSLSGPLNSLGLVINSQGFFQESLASFERARKLLEDAGQADSIEYAAVLDNIGGRLTEIASYSDARSALERALKIRRKRLGPNHPEVARSLHSLAILLAVVGDYQESRRSLESALEILSKVDGASPEHAARVECVLADLFTQQGQYARARSLKQSCLETLRKILGPEHPELGVFLMSSGDMLAAQGDTPAALEAYRTALIVTEAALGPDHPRTGLILRGFASALMCKGDSIAARITLERALALFEKSLGSDHPLLAEVLLHLGKLGLQRGDFEPGEALIRRAAEIFEAKLGPNHSGLVPMLSSLAINRFFLQQPAESATLLEKATKIANPRAENIGPGAISLLCSVASAQAATGQSAAAETSYDRALDLLQKLGRESGLEAVGILMGRGRVSLNEKDFAEARSFYEAAKHIAETDLGHRDIRTGLIIGDLGLIDWHEGKRASARRALLRSADILRSETETLLPSLSFAEQRAFLGTAVAYPVSHLLSYLDEGEDLAESYERIFPLKGLLVEALRREATLSRLAARDLATAPLVEDLRQLRTEISGLQMAQNGRGGEDRSRRIRELGNEKERLERALASRAREEGMEDALRGVRLRDLQRLLRPEEAVVDLYRFQDLSDDRPVDQYGAVVILPLQQPSLVRLGNVEKVHNAFEYWRNLITSSRSETETIEAAWRFLAELTWEPIALALPSGTSKVWLSPDDELSRVPWHLFPPDRLISQIDSVRELVRLRRGESPPRGAGRGSVLIAGNVDFDAGAGDASGRFSPLPASAAEADEIGALGLREGLDVVPLQGSQVGKKELLSRMPQVDYVHIATHGYFAKTGASFLPSGWLDGWREPWLELVGRTRSPLAATGLALSGANRQGSQLGDASGFLSAEELIGLELKHTRLVTLSACDTGRGEETTGQGVLGLRSAFLAAGARSLVMSLWKVPDEATAELMKRFYANLWQRRMPQLPALLDAQKSLREDPSDLFAAPVNWAGWILVGEGW